MNRRTAIKQLMIVAGGLALLPSCRGSVGEASIALENIQISAAEEAFLGDLVDAIIPETDSPGAKSLNLHLFVLKMLDDCHSPEDQQLVISALKKNADANSPTAIEAFLKESAYVEALAIIKRRTIQGYLNSEYVMKNKLKYELIPGRYLGEVKVQA
ncbi:gluconate 2-dehydrogenase subunit 3 family protein [Sphingobacteriaceae bacterium WQ 2009]|uniref:Gluconate 2-dehydrogenase subunit 3 family protein n=1 Tax=Rhinopithecimicrobium faecis TaxID=2820698 RepID=A0A8T4H6L5_9SPHI|nr:gluconate 2-dehydrogenase subunit 3 family protein [Sphingobacteriaceae bacterium WQ 2009]